MEVAEDEVKDIETNRSQNTDGLCPDFQQRHPVPTDAYAG